MPAMEASAGRHGCTLNYRADLSAVPRRLISATCAVIFLTSRLEAFQLRPNSGRIQDWLPSRLVFAHKSCGSPA